MHHEVTIVDHQSLASGSKRVSLSSLNPINPTANGPSPHSNSYYKLTDEHQERVLRGSVNEGVTDHDEDAPMPTPTGEHLRAVLSVNT